MSQFDPRRLETIRRALEANTPACLGAAFDPAAPQVRLHEPTFGAAEIWEALECLLSTRVTLGERVRRFENRFAAQVGATESVMVNSGSSANLLALAALTNPALAGRLEPLDEVIVPALCWSTSVWPVIQSGLVPVIVDIDPRTWNLDPARVEAAIGPRTRAVLAIHVYGNPCDLSGLQSLCRRRSLVLIEDCCEALGARFAGRAVGTFGRAGTFSFYFSHHVTTLEGGIGVSDDAELGELWRILRAHGWVRECRDPARWTAAHPDIDPRFLFVNLGYNLRPTELQAGFGLPQLEKLEDFVTSRIANAACFRRELDRWSACLDFQDETPAGRHSWFGFPVIVKETAPFGPQDLTRFLAEQGIETRPIIAGNIARQPALRQFRHRISGSLAAADRVMRRGFSFGCHPGVDAAARAHVAGAFRRFFEKTPWRRERSSAAPQEETACAS